MELRFWLHPETDLPHIFDHGVTEEEVRQVLSRTGEELPGRDRSRILSVRQRQDGICKLFTCRTLSATVHLLSPPST